MEKHHLLSILEAKKNEFSKNQSLKKILIESLLEDQSMPNLMDIHQQTKGGDIARLPKVEKEQIERKVTEKKNEEKNHGSKLKFATDLGIKAMVFNKTFINMDEQGRISISDVFSDKDIDIIINCNDCNDWKPVVRDPIYCLKSHVDRNSKTIRCFNPELNRFLAYRGKYILTVYQRDDEDSKEKMIPDPKFKDKKTGEQKEVRYVLMNPAHKEEIYILPITNKRYAVALQLPYQPDPYIFKMNYNTLSFFHTPKK